MRLLKTILAVLVAFAAATRAAAAPVTIDVPAQWATSALLMFAKQAGVEVLFSSDDLKVVRTNAVAGTFEPEEALALLLHGTGFAATRNAAGKFVVKRTPPPVAAMRGQRVVDAMRVAHNQSVPPDLTDEDPVITLDAMVVTPSRFGIAEERIAAKVTLTQQELERLPQLGEDLFRTITRLPGLAANDYAAKFLVRGAPNSQLLARLDGLDLIEPFHLKDYNGVLSIVDLETVGSIDLVTGGFTAEYGDRLAAVMTMETQSEARPGRQTTLGASVTHVRTTSQGGFAEGRGRWMAAARRGWIDLALELGGSDIDESPIYYDLSAKVEYDVDLNHTLSFHVLHAGDSNERLDRTWEPDLRSRYASTYLWGRWRGRFGERLSGEGVLSFSRLGWHREGDGAFNVTFPFTLRDDRDLRTLALRQDWLLNVTEHALLRAGGEIRSGQARYEYALSEAIRIVRDGELRDETRTVDLSLEPNGSYAAAYVAARLQPWNALVIEPGVRFERHSYTNDAGWMPRFNASLALGRTTVRAAWGAYEQTQGLHELSIGDGETTFHRAERAEQRVIGISHRLHSGMELRLEAYERRNSRVRPYSENLIEPFEVFSEALYDRAKISPTRGRARGLEFMAAQRTGRYFGWAASYAYAIAEEEIGGRWVPRSWDQRHTFYVDVTYVPAPDWQLSCSWQYHTGWPYTDIIYYPFGLNNGSLVPVWAFGPLKGLRAPPYHRLDFRATRVFRLKQGTLRAFIDIFNAYDRANDFGFDEHHAWIEAGQVTVTKTPGKMLPLIPSAGLSWEF